MKKIQIELRSDSCLSSGEVYNSSIDTEVCYDEYGLPFIPAKRIKGCLRESALELADFDLPDFEELHIGVDDIFGKAGKQEAVFSLQNARLNNYTGYLAELKSCDKKEYTNQQAVLNQFTYIRQQTSINNVTGTAEETTLRSIRVMNKGLVFEARIEIPDKYDKLFEKICKNVKFMGLNRTRGMGEVRLSYKKTEPKKQIVTIKNNIRKQVLLRKRNLLLSSKNALKDEKETILWDDTQEYNKLFYTMKLQSPILMKSVAGGQSKTIPYIEGSKILGMIAQNMKWENENFLKWLENSELICSNAYISDGKTRYVPVSASLHHVKNKKNELRDKVHKDAVKNGNDEKVQLCQLKKYYVSDDIGTEISKLSVKTELHYHHTRPKDKSKGHVIGDSNSEENGKLFYMESITEGQIFAGYILGSKEQLKFIYDFMKKRPLQRIGFSKNVEYGQVLISVTGLQNIQECSKECKDNVEKNEFVVKLNAPTIVYNEKGMYSTDENVLLQYIEEKLGEQNLEIVNRFLAYDTIGGYQTTWEAHKPVIAVFDSGTTLVIRTKDERNVNISKLQGTHLGERTQEGYGEISAYALPEEYRRKFIELPKNSETMELKLVQEKTLIQDIALTKAKEYIKFLARENAKTIQTDSRLKAVNANLLLMYEQQKSFVDFKRNISERYKENTILKTEKLRLAQEIIPEDFQLSDIIKKVTERYPEAESLLDVNMVYKIYIGSLLLTIKYAIRGEE